MGKHPCAICGISIKDKFELCYECLVKKLNFIYEVKESIKNGKDTDTGTAKT